MSDAANEHAHGTGYYIKIYVILMVLFLLSAIGPELTSVKWLVLFLAFGIAIIKALMVAAYFMHLNIEKRMIWSMLYTMLIFVVIFFAGVSPDVMKPTGTNWENKAALQHIKDHEGWADKGGDHEPETHE